MSSTPDAFSARREGDRAVGCGVGEAKGREAAEEAVAAFRPARVFSRVPADRLARKANLSVQAAQALTSMFLQESQAQAQEEKSAQAQSQEEKSAQSQPCQEKPQEKKAEPTAHRPSQQATGKGQAALYSGSPTCSVSAGVVASA
jgi:hypothetical protein